MSVTLGVLAFHLVHALMHVVMGAVGGFVFGKFNNHAIAGTIGGIALWTLGFIVGYYTRGH